MRTLMISLDQEILNSESRVASRMRSYGENHALDIIIPTKIKKIITLSLAVTAYGSGGSKWQQFFRLWQRGHQLTMSNQYEVITTQDPFLVGLIGILLKQKKQTLEVQLHGDFFSNSYYRRSGIKNWLYYYLARYIVIPRADKIRVVGERVKQSLLKLGIKESKINIHPITVPSKAIQGYSPKQDAHDLFPEFNKIFLFLGRLDKVKNVAWLIDVFAEYKQQSNEPILLLIAGDGPERSRLESLIKSSGAEKYVQFLGWLSNPLDYLKTVDCLVFPSLSEGYGLVAMEAAAAGTKIIMTDVGVANFELSPSEHVKIVDVNDRAGFTAALKNV